MKKYQKGFITPLILAIVALLIIGGSVYIYKSKKVEVPVSSTNTEVQNTNQQTDAQNHSNNSGASTSLPISVNWKIYSSAQYGFSIQYPTDSKINDSSMNGGRKISFITSHGTVMVEVISHPIIVHDLAYGDISSPPNCNDTAGGQDRTNTNINGVDFLTYSMSKEYSGAYGHISATEYCAIQSGTAYKIIPQIEYTSGSHPPDVDKDPTLNQVVHSFKLNK